MVTGAFIGTFDPLHGGHIGQMLRANKFMPFSKILILVNKNPSHKPGASSWQDRMIMAKLTLDSYDTPFEYGLIAIENSEALDLADQIDYKIIGIDSLTEDLQEPNRWKLARQWPMIVLSVPDIPKSVLTDAIAKIPPDVRPTIKYEYVSEDDVPIMNYDFDLKKHVSHRVHAEYLRAGRQSSLIPPNVRDYMRQHKLYY